jgi:protocatechuate 3,4-dioxygenase beta subunit
MCLLIAQQTVAQGLTGALFGTVKDEQGAVLKGAIVRVTSPALIGGSVTMTTNDRGQLRFPALTPGTYTVDVELPGFAPYHEDDILLGAGATLSRHVVLNIAGVAPQIEGWLAR